MVYGSRTPGKSGPKILNLQTRVRFPVALPITLCFHLLRPIISKQLRNPIELLRNRGSTWEHVEAARRGYILEYSRLSQHPSPRPRPTPRGGERSRGGHRGWSPPPNPNGSHGKRTWRLGSCLKRTSVSRRTLTKPLRGSSGRLRGDSPPRIAPSPRECANGDFSLIPNRLHSPALWCVLKPMAVPTPEGKTTPGGDRPPTRFCVFSAITAATLTFFNIRDPCWSAVFSL